MTVRDWLTLGWSTDSREPLVNPWLLLNGPLFGLFFGWPCFLLGGGAWALLHRAGRVGPTHAALIGASAPLLPLGGIIITIGRPWDTAFSMIPPPLALAVVAIGAVTGLVVWRIAYPRTAAVS